MLYYVLFIVFIYISWCDRKARNDWAHKNQDRLKTRLFESFTQFIIVKQILKEMLSVTTVNISVISQMD